MSNLIENFENLTEIFFDDDRSQNSMDIDHIASSKIENVADADKKTGHMLTYQGKVNL